MRRLLFTLSAIVMMVAATTPAVAGERRPPDLSVTQNNLLVDEDACGDYGVAWDIHLTVDIWFIRDAEGRLLKVIQEVEEDNTVTNTVSGLALREGPDDFTQVDTYDPETGLRETIHITGVSVNVLRGDQKLVDHGPILIDGQTGDIQRQAGSHPVRDLMDGSFDINLALPAFCEILG